MKRAASSLVQQQQLESGELVTPKLEFVIVKESKHDDPLELGVGDYDGCGGDDDEVPDRSTKSVRTSPRVEFTAVQEEELVQWLQEHPLFYDQSNPDFKNRGKKEELVDMKAAEMNVRPTHVLTWFKSMRTVYGKLKRKSRLASKVLTARQKWTLSNFSFLDSHLSFRTERRRQGVATTLMEAAPLACQGVATTLMETAPFASEEEESDSNIHRPPSRNSQASTSSGLRQPHKRVAGSKQQLEDAIMLLVSKLSDRDRVSSESSSFANRNPREAFAHWMGCQTMGLSEYQWRLFMVDVVNCVNRHCEADNQRQPPTGTQHQQHLNQQGVQW